MSGLHALMQEFNTLKSQGLPIPPELEEALKRYQAQAAEAGQELLARQANERQAKLRQGANMK